MQYGSNIEARTVEEKTHFALSFSMEPTEVKILIENLLS